MEYSVHDAGKRLFTNQLTIRTANLPYQLVGVQPTDRIVIRANTGNQGNIFVGNQGVSSTTGFILDATDAQEFKIDLSESNKSGIWICGDTVNDGVSFFYITDDV